MKKYLTLPLLISLIFSLGCSPALRNWEMYKSDVRHSGTKETTAVKNLDLLNVKVKIFKTQGPVVSSPAIVNNIAYFGSIDKNLYAVDLVNMKQKWKFTAEKAIFSSPAIDDGILYFGNGSIISAVRISDGKSVWGYRADRGDHLLITHYC
jgi:eukaryotic-like serine/threonine-protein kinase